MTYFENQCKNKFKYFQRIWLRYVDDVFAIFDNSKENIPNFLGELNSQFETIKLFVEEEKNLSLPFLDSKISRNNNKLRFSIYRKPTHTDKYIPNDSNHHIPQKLAPFHTMINRLLSIPMSTKDFKTVLKHIENTAR
jgi:hypothetical protein